MSEENVCSCNIGNACPLQHKKEIKNATSQEPEVSIVRAVSADAMERALGRAKVCGGRACGEPAGRTRVCVLRVQEEGGNRLRR